MTALGVSVLLASLLGSVHCAGMCGGLVALYAGGGGPGAARAHAVYNAGRLAGYALLGAMAGAAGGALDLAGSLAGVQRAAALVAAAFVALWGAAMLLEARGAPVIRLATPRALERIVSRAIRAVATRSPVARALALGAATAALPCGWLWAFLVTAAGTGRPGEGAALMAIFWAGTLPAMVGVGLGVQALSAPLRRRLPMICALLLIAVGGLSLAGRTGLIGHVALHAPALWPPAAQRAASGGPHAHP
jgi:hypothetical protein